MTKTNDALHQFVNLRGALERERTALQARLVQINQALGISDAPRRGRPPGTSNKVAAPASAPAAPKAAAPKAAAPKPAQAPKPAAKAPAKPASSPAGVNKMSMRETIAKAVGKGALPIGEVVAAMKRSGYIFKSSNPVNSVGAYLYGPEGKKHFVRNNGKFSLKR